MTHKTLAICLLTFLASAITGCGTPEGADGKGGQLDTAETPPATESSSGQAAGDPAMASEAGEIATPQPPLESNPEVLAGGTDALTPTELPAGQEAIITDVPTGTLDDPVEEPDEDDEDDEDPVS